MKNGYRKTREKEKKTREICGDWRVKRRRGWIKTIERQESEKQKKERSEEKQLNKSIQEKWKKKLAREGSPLESSWKIEENKLRCKGHEKENCRKEVKKFLLDNCMLMRERTIMSVEEKGRENWGNEGEKLKGIERAKKEWVERRRIEGEQRRI